MTVNPFFALEVQINWKPTIEIARVDSEGATWPAPEAVVVDKLEMFYGRMRVERRGLETASEQTILHAVGHETAGLAYDLAAMFRGDYERKMIPVLERVIRKAHRDILHP